MFVSVWRLTDFVYPHQLESMLLDRDGLDGSRPLLKLCDFGYSKVWRILLFLDSWDLIIQLPMNPVIQQTRRPLKPRNLTKSWTQNEGNLCRLCDPKKSWLRWIQTRRVLIDSTWIQVNPYKYIFYICLGPRARRFIFKTLPFHNS